ncbi:GNAT family N-acetyltransferase [Microlunatus elymi]|nr:GNAT family N-acetyltransferase [Microlunatus elymi]
MGFQLVRPDDAAAVAVLTDLGNAAQAVDDPESPAGTPELTAGWLRYGWDLEPDQRYLYRPSEDDDPVGVLNVGVPKRDNLHLVTGGITVHPDQRRQGHGSAMLAELLRQTRELGRRTVWLGCAADDDGAAAFLKQHGFSYASHDARRYQWPSKVDQDHVAALYAEARQAAADYEVVRTQVPTDDQLLAELIEVTAAINDAPMGELEFEPEKFDLQRLKDFEYAGQQKGERIYRIFARHRHTGVVGGHTVMMVQPSQPTFGNQYDTAVHRDHRGHRLGMLLKIEMMRWMADAEPQIERIETWNNADNSYMINVNEAIGYRLSRIFDSYQLAL